MNDLEQRAAVTLPHDIVDEVRKALRSSANCSRAYHVEQSSKVALANLEDAITAALSAQPPSEAVAWQWRSSPNGIEWSKWAEWDREDFPRTVSIDGQPHVVQYRPVYAAPQPREVRGVDAGWIFYFTDDEGTPFVHYCGSRDELEQAVVNHWFQGDDAEADDGQRMAPGIADELARSGVFHAEDGSCYAKPINVSIAGLGVGRVDLRQEKVSVGVTSSSLESVPATADGAHEVQPEAIEAGLGLVGGELGLAADANPHSDGSIHLIATTPQDAAAPGVGND